MVKAIGTLFARGIVGMISIATTAVITVLIQRYLYENPGAPAFMPASPRPHPSQPIQSEPIQSELEPPSDIPDPTYPVNSTESDVGATTDPISENQGNSPTRTMKQFWDKLNH